MPCNSDHMEQTSREAAIQHAAEVLSSVHTLLGMTVPQKVLDANTYYANDKTIIPLLCAMLKALGEEERDRLLYSDAKDKRRRAIADWWEKHLEADREREEEEAEDRRVSDLAASARAKLTSDELEALKDLL